MLLVGIIMKKLILFGGTFDPVHNGHIAMADCVAEQKKADEIIFIPVARSPHKKLFPVANPQARFEMITIAINDRKKFSVSDFELKNPHPSYTVNTIRHFRRKYRKNVHISWLIGADMLRDLDKWHKIYELIDQCQLSVMLRGGCERPDFGHLKATLGPQRILKLEKNIIVTPMIDISSTKIRQKLARKEDVSEMLNASVMDYIKQRGLYTHNCR